MTNTFINGDTVRTFADKKGAAKAIKRDLNKHADAHGDLFVTAIDYEQANEGRWGVLVSVDMTATEIRKVLGDELAGYGFKAEGVDAKPVAAPVAAKKPETSKTPAASDDTKQRKGSIEIIPVGFKPIAARFGSKQQALIELLQKGATMDDFREVCVKGDGTPWTDASIRSAMYYDVREKGYGVRTEWNDETPKYFLVLPEGFDAPLEARKPQSAKTKG